MPLRGSLFYSAAQLSGQFFAHLASWPLRRSKSAGDDIDRYDRQRTLLYFIFLAQSCSRVFRQWRAGTNLGHFFAGGQVWPFGGSARN
ncbi:unnamed protein product [Amoebophrya sp. A25]|nr:unnamed protein product [Amoebophrya sp. A25]|eukprot:GSA25T00005581001.1